jgi:DNA replication licensing factor MCM7
MLLGICCIDEFDKMLVSKQEQLLEPMEQGTATISKATVRESFKANTSILAAGNSKWSTYDPRKSLMQNLDYSQALISRFDLLFVIVDTHDLNVDLESARHITYVHTHGKVRPIKNVIYTESLIKRYIKLCKRKNPTIPENLAEYLVHCYVTIRKLARTNKDTTYTGARTLQSIMRLSIALARFYLKDLVEKCHVDEVLRLINASKEGIHVPKRTHNDRSENVVFNIIHEIIVELAEQPCKKLRMADDGEESKYTAKMSDITNSCQLGGISKEELDSCISLYEQLKVYECNGSNTTITIIKSIN